MKPRFLGIALIVLAGLALLNLFQAFARTDNDFHETTAAVAVAETSSEDFDFDFDFDFDVDQAGSELGQGTVVIDERFKVIEGEHLVIDVQHSDIDIQTRAGGDEARIIVTVRSRNMNRAMERFDAMDFRTHREGDRVVLRSAMPRGINWRTRMNIDVVAIVPQRFNVDVQSTHGDVELADLEGDLEVRTTHGDVEMGRVEGDRAAIKTTHGDIESRDLVIRTLQVKTTHGDIEMGRVITETFDASTTHSDIDIQMLAGRSEIRTTHGDVRITVEDTEGLDVRTTHGDVDINVPSDFRADLDLRGERVELPGNANFKGEVKKKSADGSLNGGGPRVDISTTHGHVAVRGR